MLKLSSVLAIAMSFTYLTGCSVYKSSDREDFNANGKARAPALTSKPTDKPTGKPTDAVLSDEDAALLQSPCEAFRSMSIEQIELVFGTSRITFTNQVSRKTSTCLVESADAVASSESLDSLAVLACSWKPVDGQSIPVHEALNGQTTENDYRRQGFRVLTSGVTSGNSLRMNCEAYVATPALVRADEQPESAERLTLRFVDLTFALNRSTLTSTLQR